MDEVQKLKLSQEYMGLEEEEDAGQICLNHPQSAQDTKKEEDGEMERWIKFLKSKQIIYKASLPGGGYSNLLKTALSTGCERNCNYCAFRSGRDFRRIVYTPDELAAMYMKLWQRKAVQGLFLSSGLAGGGVATQDRLIKTAEILREKYHYSGYLHLKIMPSCEKAQVERSMQLADRVSVNLEAPSKNFLKELAPQKEFYQELLRPLKWADEIRSRQPDWKNWKGRWASSATQFVVGPAGEKDLDLLSVSSYLLNTLHLRRTFYSAFNPIQGTPFEDQMPEQFVRKVRLYQASYLLRDYQFSLEDLPFDQDQNLPLKIDPKLAWAEIHLKENPVEINQADYEDLLRIPGIGLIGAKRILSSRKINRLQELKDLQILGIQTKRAEGYILLDGRRPQYQMKFW